jgi:hypothetical protein
VVYLGSHTYYKDVLSVGANRGILISAIVCALPPLLYLLRAKRFNVKTLAILLGCGVAVFGLIHSMRKGGTIGFGWFITIFNSLLLFALGTYTLVGFFALGSFIERKRLKFSQHRWQELLLTLGIGLIVFLAIVQILLGIGILFSVVSWILFLGL